MLILLLLCVLYYIYVICKKHEHYTDKIDHSDKFKIIEHVILSPDSIISKTKLDKQLTNSDKYIITEKCINTCYNNSTCKGVTIDYNNDSHQCITNYSSDYIENEFTNPNNNKTRYVSYINNKFKPKKLTEKKTLLIDKFSDFFQRLRKSLNNNDIYSAKNEADIIEGLVVTQCQTNLNNVV